MPKLGLGLSLPQTRVTSKPPIPKSGLSLWLKSNAGVINFSFSYASQIVISGTSNPNFAGTYTADQVPTWDFGEGRPLNYNLSGPTGKAISWDNGAGLFTVTSEAGPGSFSSSNGASWSPNTIISQFVITGFTGIYSGANGTYLYVEDGYYDRDGGGYYVQGTTLYDSNYEIGIATNSNNYQGAWTPTTYLSTITLSNAGTTSVNGVYTRTDSSLDMFGIGFSASGGRSILYDDNDGFWFTSPNDYYRNYDESLNTTAWATENGNAPAPTAVNSNSSRNVGSPTSTTTTAPTGSITGSVTLSTVDTNIVLEWQDQSGNGNNAIAPAGYNPTTSTINGFTSVRFDTPESYGGTYNMLQIAGAPFDQIVSFTSFFVATNENADAYANGNIFGLFGGDIQRKLQLTSGYMLLNGGDYNGGVNPNIGENAYGNVPLTLFGVRPDINNGTAKTVTAFKQSWNKDDGDTIVEVDAGRYDYTGQLSRGPLIGFTDVTDGDAYIGSAGGSAENLRGDICEIIIYNRALTDQEFENVVTYLNTKYAIY